jgi:phenylpyruvate tautomerase PptA (4-oxalocrotonate tautomerase family)
MPLLSLTTSAAPPTPEKRAALYSDITRLLARELDKPEAYVMVILNAGATMSFGGNASAPACYAELKNVGTIDPAHVTILSRLLCGELERALGVEQDRIYIEFTNADGALWGWNGTTFA